MAETTTDKAGLVNNETSAPMEDPPPPYSGPEVETFSEVPHAQPSPLPSQAQEGGGSTMIHCQVCQMTVDISHQTGRVVKCSMCCEATPIKPAPLGKKYLRCPCKALLTCSTNAVKVSCPRSNCRRVLFLTHGERSSVQPGTQGVAINTVQELIKYKCAYCYHNFVFRFGRQSLARCPHCNHLTSAGTYARKVHMVLFALVGLLMIGIGVGLTAATFKMASEGHYGYYAGYTGFFVSGILLCMRSLYLCTIKVSYVFVLA